MMYSQLKQLKKINDALLCLIGRFEHSGISFKLCKIIHKFIFLRLVLVSCLITPLMLAFDLDTNITIIFYLDQIVNFLFFIDLILNFFMA